jgi:hypothetical protein
MHALPAAPDARIAVPPDVHRTMHALLSAPDRGDSVAPRMDKRSRRWRMQLLASYVKAIPKHFGFMPWIPFGQRQWKPAELAAFFQDELDSIKAVIQAEAALKQARLRERTTWKKNRTMHQQVGGLIDASFTEADKLADFAHKPQKPGYKSAETKAKAAEKAQATKEERGTTGRKRKKKHRS